MTKETSLLIYNLFIATPNAKEARSAFLEYITEFVLFNSKTSLTLNEVANKINNFFQNPISSELITTALKKVAISEKEADGEEKFVLSIERKSTFTLAIDRFNSDKEAFNNILINKVQENISEELTPTEKKCLCETIEKVIATIFSDKYKLLGQFFNPKSPFDIYKLEEKEYDIFLRNELKKVFDAKYNIEKLMYGVIKTLKQLDNNGEKYVSSIFYKVFAFFYLNQEPNELQKEIRLLKRRKLYLDANIILKLIFPSQGKQKEISPLIEQCGKLKIQLLITPNTLKEIEEQFNFAEKIFKENVALHPEIRSKYLSQHRKKLIIIDDYLNERIENKSLDWEVYLHSFMPIKEYLFKKFEIKTDKDQWSKIKFNTTEIDLIRNVIKDTKEKHRENIGDKRPVATDSLICDSQNIFFIHQLRDKFQTDDMGIRIWHLTYDIPLVKSERLAQHLFNIPACMTVSQLADFLIPFSMTTMEEVSHGQFVASILSADFGAIVEDENYVDIDFYINLTNSGLPLEHIIDIADDRFTRKILVLFQEKKKVRDLAEEVEKTGDSEKKAVIINTLQNEFININAESKCKESIDVLKARINKLELERASPKKKEGNYFAKILAMFKDKILLFSRIVLDLSILIFLNYGVIWVYARLNTESHFMIVLKNISHIAIILFICFDAYKEIKKAWNETKES